jgi:hypothetical protein
MNEQHATRPEDSGLAGAPDLRSQAWWQKFQADLAELRSFNSELAALSEQHMLERDAARSQVEALRKALGALRALSQHTSDAAVLRMSIEELAASAQAEA